MYISLVYQDYVLFNFYQTIPKMRYFPNCKGPGPIPNILEKKPVINFLCIFLGEKGGGGALMHVYVWEHIVSFYYRTA